MVSFTVCSLEIGSDYFEQLLGSLGVKCARMLLRVDQVCVDVILNHFRHQSRDRPPRTRDQVHDLFTAGLGIERTLNSLDLTPDAAYPRKELLLFTNSMRHR
jgi:hypothetical protein